MDVLMFTPAGLLDLLSKIDELKDFDIGITEAIDGSSLLIQIGESSYEVAMESERDIPTDDTALIEIDDANVEAYENLVDSGTIEMHDMEDSGIKDSGYEDIESGFLTEVAKTLLIGGMVRLVGKEFKK